MLAGDLELTTLFLDLVEQPCVLDGDGRLRSEGPEEANSFRGEGADALAAHDKGADQLILVQERHGEQRAHAGLHVHLEEGVMRHLT